MANVNLTINGKPVEVPSGTTILEAAKSVGIRIPTLCAYEGMGPHASCRLCIVKIEGEEKEKLSCAVKVSEGMAVQTDSEELYVKRRETLMEMFRQHKVDCHQCARTGGSWIEELEPEICENCFYCDCQREGFCELQALAREFKISELPFEIHQNDFQPDESTGTIVRDPNKCVKCRRCVDVCKNSQGVGVLGMVKTENGQTVGVATAETLAQSECIRCGRCIDVCPTGAVYLKEHKDELPYYTHMRDVSTAVLIDDSVLPELSTLYGAGPDGISMGQLVSALKKIGVDNVFDAEEVRRLVSEETAEKLSRRRKKSPAIIAVDPSSKAFLEQKYADKKADFIFVETAQSRFAKLIEGKFDKVYRISGRNSLATEVQDSECADYFYNARELFRILKRTGANPLRLKESKIDSLGLDAEPTDYDSVLGGVPWEVGGRPEKISLTIKDKVLTAVICHNPEQLKQVMTGKETYDIIRINT